MTFAVFLCIEIAHYLQGLNTMTIWMLESQTGPVKNVYKLNGTNYVVLYVLCVDEKWFITTFRFSNIWIAAALSASEWNSSKKSKGILGDFVRSYRYQSYVFNSNLLCTEYSCQTWLPVTLLTICIKQHNVSNATLGMTPEEVCRYMRNCNQMWKKELPRNHW